LCHIFLKNTLDRLTDWLIFRNCPLQRRRGIPKTELLGIARWEFSWKPCHCFTNSHKFSAAWPGL